MKWLCTDAASQCHPLRMCQSEYRLFKKLKVLILIYNLFYTFISTRNYWVTEHPWNLKHSKNSIVWDVLLYRLRIGHWQFTNGYLLKSLEALTCEKCKNKTQTAQHIPIEFQQYEEIRKKAYRLIITRNSWR